jgi:hypothetical protein
MSISNLCSYFDINQISDITRLSARHDKFADNLKYRMSYLERYLSMEDEEFKALPNHASIDKQIESYNDAEAYYLQVTAALKIIEERFQELDVQYKCLRANYLYLQSEKAEKSKQADLDSAFQGDVHRSEQREKWEDHIKVSPEYVETAVCTPHQQAQNLAAYDPVKAHADWEKEQAAKARWQSLHKEANQGAQPNQQKPTLQTLSDYANRAKAQIK